MCFIINYKRLRKIQIIFTFQLSRRYVHLYYNQNLYKKLFWAE